MVHDTVVSEMATQRTTTATTATLGGIVEGQISDLNEDGPRRLRGVT